MSSSFLGPSAGASIILSNENQGRLRARWATAAATDTRLLDAAVVVLADDSTRWSR